MECVQQTSTDVTEYIYGRCTLERRQGRDRDPRASTRSWSAGARARRSPGSTRCRPTTARRPTRCCTGRSTRWSGSARVLIAPRALARRSAGGASATSRRRSWFLRAVAVSGVAAVVALECGWIVTEVGRQPWIVYNVMRTEDAVTHASGVWVTFVDRARALHRARRGAGARRCARCRGAGASADERGRRGAVRPDRRRRPTSLRRRRMSSADAVAVVLVDRRDGRTPSSAARTSAPGSGACSPAAATAAGAPRELIDWAIGPVWEANHVWLIFVLVVLWTGFSSAFEAIFSTLFIPLSLAALGIVLRGSGFAFQHDRAARRGPAARRAALRAVVAAHAVLHGHGRRRDRRRPRAGRQRRRRRRDELAQPALARDRRALRRDQRLPRRRCSSSATPAAPAPPTSSATSPTARSSPALVAGALAVAGLVALHSDARYVFDRLTSEALPLVILSVALRARPCSCCSAAAPGAAPVRSRSARSPP